jgi:DNA-binding transcriptional regulator YdaS (Cro superfamily)
MYTIQAYQLIGVFMFIYKTQAIKFAGSKSKLARLLGISRQAVNGWPDRKPIPQKQAIKLVKISPEVFK